MLCTGRYCPRLLGQYNGADLSGLNESTSHILHSHPVDHRLALVGLWGVVFEQSHQLIERWILVDSSGVSGSSDFAL